MCVALEKILASWRLSYAESLAMNIKIKFALNNCNGEPILHPMKLSDGCPVVEFVHTQYPQLYVHGYWKNGPDALKRFSLSSVIQIVGVKSPTKIYYR